MATKDKRVDAYISKSAAFAKPILTHLRELVHEACPDVTETMKWSFPHFDYKGIMCSMAAFKQHASFGFWKASLMEGYDKLQPMGETAMGHFGQLKNMKDLPSDKILLAYIREASRLNENGVKLPQKARPTKASVRVPADFRKALDKNKKASTTFDTFSYSNKKDYVEWITEAKSDDTRKKRMKTSVEWLSEGKNRNWKYMK